MPTEDCVGGKRKIALAKLLPGRMVLIIIAQIFKARAHNLPHCVCVCVRVWGTCEMELGNETRNEKKRIYKYNKILLNRCFHVQKKGIPQITMRSLLLLVVVVAFKLTPCFCCNNCDRRQTAIY